MPAVAPDRLGYFWDASFMLSRSTSIECVTRSQDTARQELLRARDDFLRQSHIQVITGEGTDEFIFTSNHLGRPPWALGRVYIEGPIPLK
jgi:hypothetical protein